VVIEGDGEAKPFRLGRGPPRMCEESSGGEGFRFMRRRDRSGRKTRFSARRG